MSNITPRFVRIGDSGILNIHEINNIWKCRDLQVAIEFKNGKNYYIRCETERGRDNIFNELHFILGGSKIGD